MKKQEKQRLTLTVSKLHTILSNKEALLFYCSQNKSLSFPSI